MLTLLSTLDSPAPQLKVDIRNAPISEEGPDADTIMADMASTLRAVCHAAGL